jgi:hypothetical protein
MILEKLAVRFAATFPEQDFGFTTEQSGEKLVIPPKHADFGLVEITEEGDELILFAGNFTHGHFASYNDALSPNEKANEIIDDITDFLAAMFEDQVVFWGSNQKGGGWYRIDIDSELLPQENNSDEFLWSGPRHH